MKNPKYIAKSKISSYQNSENISCKIDMGSNSNILPFHIYKIIFPRSTKSLCQELKVNKRQMVMQTTGRETANTKEQSRQKAGCLRAVQTKGRIQKHKINIIQTIQPIQVLILIQWSWVTITMKKIVLSESTKKDMYSLMQS